MGLEAFLRENSLPAEGRKVAVSPRFLQKDGSPVLWEIRPVTAGEEDHILPFKRFADYELDSFMPYEGAVYASLLTGENLPQHRLTGKLRRFLEFLPSLSQENVPGDSLLREFIGEIEE